MNLDQLLIAIICSLSVNYNPKSNYFLRWKKFLLQIVIRIVITINFWYNIKWNIRKWRGGFEVDKKGKTPMQHFNIGEFNRGQSSKLLRELAENDKTAYILKNGKPIAVVLSNERYERLLGAGIDIRDY